MIKLRNLKLIGLMSLFVGFNSYSAVDINKQTKIKEMLAEFLNLSCQPNKGFETWIDQLRELIEKEPDFAAFLPVLSTIRNNRNPNIVKLEIFKNRTKAPIFVQQILNAKKADELSNILAARVKVRSV